MTNIFKRVRALVSRSAHSVSLSRLLGGSTVEHILSTQSTPWYVWGRPVPEFSGSPFQFYHATILGRDGCDNQRQDPPSSDGVHRKIP